MGIESQTRIKPSSAAPTTSVRSLLLQPKCACNSSAEKSGECEACGKRAAVLRRSSGHSFGGEAPSIVGDVLASSGRPLDPATRAPLEQHFGHDFSRVRVHADSRAAESADAVGAAAFTVGQDIVFGQGRYAPESHQGRRLLAHELGHTIQQKDARPAGTLPIADPSDAAESEAERASQLAGPGDGAMLGRHDRQLQRQTANADAAGKAAGNGADPSKQAPTVKKPEVQTITGIKLQGQPIFDAELDRRGAASDQPCRLTLSTKVLFKPQGQWPPGEFAKWQQDYIRVVTNRWSFRFLLIPASPCQDEPCKIATAQVRVIPVTSNPHHTLNVDYEKPEGVPSVTNLPPDPSQAYRLDVRRFERDLRTSHATASHEFGHMLGLEHVHCPANEEECYGTNREERADVMGHGEIVTERDYKPFVNAIRDITGCDWQTKGHGGGPVFGNASRLLAGFLGGVGLAAGVLLGLGSIAGMVELGAVLGGLGTFVGYQVGKLLD